MNMKMGIEAALRICFLLFLLSASWQDLRKRLLKKYVPDMGNGRSHSSGSTYFQPDFYGNRKNGNAGDRTGSYGPYVCSFIGNFVISLSTATEEAMGKGDGCFFLVAGIFLGFWKKYAAVIRRSVFMFPGSCLSDDKGKKSEKYRKHPVLAICVFRWDWGSCFYE